MTYKNKIRFDVGISILVVIIFIIAILFDSCWNNYIPKFLIVHVGSIEDLMNTLFTVQASVATLGTAIVALMSEVSKEKVYGMTVSKFVMQIKPVIFKHKIIILFQLLLITFGYVALGLKFYNILVALFFITMILIIIMIQDIFTVFSDPDSAVKDVSNYYLFVFKKNKAKCELIFKNIKEDIEQAIQNKNTIVIQNDLELLEKILQIILENGNKKGLLLFNNVTIDILNRIFESNNINAWIITINKLKEFYKKCNELNNENQQMYLDIFDGCFENLMNAISKLVCNDLIDKIELYSLHKELYRNVQFKKNNNNSYQKNNKYLSVFSGRLYYLNEKNAKKSNSNNEAYKFNISLFKNLKYLIAYFEYEKIDERMELVYDELLKYTKILIDEKETILEKTFFKEAFVSYGDGKKGMINYIFVIMIYLYYLVSIEDDEKLVSQTERNLISSLLKNNKSKFIDFLHKYHVNMFSKEFENFANEKLRFWERMPEDEAKSINMDYAVQNFIIMNCIYFNSNKKSLKESIIPFVKNRVIYIYSSYAGKNKDIIERKYRSYLELFLIADEQEEVISNRIKTLEDCIVEIYKENEIRNAYAVKKDNNYFRELEKICGESITKHLKEKINIFNAEVSKNENKKDILLNLTTEVSLLDRKALEEDIFELLYNITVSRLINVIRPCLLIENTKNSDEEALSIFFENLKKYGIDVETLIGYKSWFYGQKKEKQFRLFEKNCKLIKSANNSNVLIGVDSRLVYFNINKLNIKIEKMNLDDFPDIKKDTNDNYLYNITNDIYIPFSKRELEQYINDTKRKVIFELDYNFGFLDDIIGVGII
ncbi:hypothetical protein [Clostridium beijerinckii]|uniref:Uncharacterized protein n=1 Tax=Clostridium beijerinckii TaxID=1520 RepID=A0A1S8S1J2_CLOBE|nr:hypothetical protein [Clostridium beijerinckii]NRY60675.1 hypothetical protein [Clostridium beijerinckii]OOM59294.1 hypothetical protein CLBCK_35930 [Clostridium beijerinckii]